MDPDRRGQQLTPDRGLGGSHRPRQPGPILPRGWGGGAPAAPQAPSDRITQGAGSSPAPPLRMLRAGEHRPGACTPETRRVLSRIIWAKSAQEVKNKTDLPSFIDIASLEHHLYSLCSMAASEIMRFGCFSDCLWEGDSFPKALP